MDVGYLRTSLQNRLAHIVGLRAYRTAPAVPVLPCAIVRPGPIVVHSTFDEGFGEIGFHVQVLVDMTSWDEAQDALDVYISTGSIVDALEHDGDFDGLSVEVHTIDPQGQVQYGALQCATVTFVGTVLN